jgi:hypothetical protein
MLFEVRSAVGKSRNSLNMAASWITLKGMSLWSFFVLATVNYWLVGGLVLILNSRETPGTRRGSQLTHRLFNTYRARVKSLLLYVQYMTFFEFPLSLNVKTDRIE